MAIKSLRVRPRPDNLANQARQSQSLARRIYLGALVAGAGWIAYSVAGPLLLLAADGLVMQDREVVGAEYTAQVVSVSVKPGDRVAQGQPIASVVSTQMLDLVSDLETRLAQSQTRRLQIEARLGAIQSTLPSAERRAQDAEAAWSVVDKAGQKGFSTVTRRAELAHERYEAAREEASLRAERSSLVAELDTLAANRERLTAALDKARTAYRDGIIVAPVDGTVGARVASPGSVLRPGEAVADLHHGRKFVVAYVPTNRLYAIHRGDAVVVSDGATRREGRVERIEGLTDTLPGEFQPNFAAIERRQVIRVGLEDGTVFPLQAKITVSTPLAPANLIDKAQSLVVSAAAAAASVAMGRGHDPHVVVSRNDP
ncbi:hypothetical protein SLNSH_04600 [Alsobacter soli]|uniref:Uncharacterized protein n=1 Tax=Alsobacter soli TaxID=2109933 RepID=A0A2T1HWN7_9HYPH|nr:HlyD family efflux transporter periplasmic adaptor subunit [Alsobacter soli]PSC06091.1 hypothetical protein SLNSH_04600 [Alsobacter soli]